jgi:hypothetical protein
MPTSSIVLRIRGSAGGFSRGIWRYWHSRPLFTQSIVNPLKWMSQCAQPVASQTNVSAFLEADTTTTEKRLLKLARTWIEVADHVEDGACFYDTVDRLWLRRQGWTAPINSRQKALHSKDLLPIFDQPRRGHASHPRDCRCARNKATT